MYKRQGVGADTDNSDVSDGVSNLPVIRGTTRDCETGNILGLCTVRVYRTIDGTLVSSTTSDVDGVFLLPVLDFVEHYFIVASATGPQRAGATANDLVAEI